MLLGIGLDGGDSPSGGCTTHLAAIILKTLLRQGYIVADYPWLVRLNPSVPRKTRGNGAVAIWLVLDREADAEKVVAQSERIARMYAEASGAGGKLGIVALLYEDDTLPPHDPSLSRLYWLALREYVPRDTAIAHLSQTRGALLVAKGGSIVGAAAALGARLDYDHTFELLAYMPPKLWGRRPRLPAELVARIDYLLGPHSIATYDYIEGKPLIQPHGPDPVYAGIRAEEPDPLLNALRLLPREHIDAFMLYRTNQHTGLHIVARHAAEARVYRCLGVYARITSARRLPGGHATLELCDHTGCLTAAVYRESRMTGHAMELVGRRAWIEGCVKPHRSTATLNVERIVVEETGAVIEPPAAAWHHLFEPASRARRVQRPRGLRRLRAERITTLLGKLLSIV